MFANAHPQDAQVGTRKTAELRLKIGAQVMLLKNSPKRKLVKGIVTGFVEVSDLGKAGIKSISSNYILNGVVAPNFPAPVVQFANGTTVAVLTVLIVGGDTPNAGEIARREQVPLKLALAMTIHNVQGMTIDYLRVDLNRIFQPQQAYVAVVR